MRTHLNGVVLCIAMLAVGTAFSAASTFQVTEAENGAYNGTVWEQGDGYAFTAEDSARYYKFLKFYSDLLLDGAVCAGSTNWHTANIGTYASHPVTVTNGARIRSGVCERRAQGQDQEWHGHHFPVRQLQI